MYSILLLPLFFLFKQLFCHEKQIIYKCGADKYKIKPKVLGSFINNNENVKSNKRRIDNLNCEQFKKFNIYLDLENIKQEIINYNLERYRELFISSLENAAKTLEKLLMVENCSLPFDFSDDDIEDNINIATWNKSMFGTNAKNNGINSQTLDIDLVSIWKI